MGWGDCGTDSQGRPIGYVFPATCDEPGCTAEIDRGLSYACGDMHGETEAGCERYFCEKHRQNWVEISDGDLERICSHCASSLLESGDVVEDSEDGVLRPAPSVAVEWRQVRNARRASRLRKRGEFIQWSREHHCWVWLREIVWAPARTEEVGL